VAVDVVLRIGGGLALPTSATGVVGVALTSVCFGRRTYNPNITQSMQIKWNGGAMTLDNVVFYGEGFDTVRGFTIDGNRK
jgi:hypothetical protein